MESLTEKYLTDSNNKHKIIKDGIKALGLITKNIPMTQAERKDIFSRASMFLRKKLQDMNEGKSSSTPMECMECGHKFKKKIGKKTVEVKCPKCKGYDTDVA